MKIILYNERFFDVSNNKKSNLFKASYVGKM